MMSCWHPVGMLLALSVYLADLRFARAPPFSHPGGQLAKLRAPVP
jgi:hypothetical protein